MRNELPARILFQAYLDATLNRPGLLKRAQATAEGGQGGQNAK